MSVCVACVAAGQNPPAESTVTVAGTEYCNIHGVNAWQMQMSPGLSRRMMNMINSPAQQ